MAVYMAIVVEAMELSLRLDIVDSEAVFRRSVATMGERILKNTSNFVAD